MPLWQVRGDQTNRLQTSEVVCPAVSAEGGTWDAGQGCSRGVSSPEGPGEQIQLMPTLPLPVQYCVDCTVF